MIIECEKLTPEKEEWSVYDSKTGLVREEIADIASAEEYMVRQFEKLYADRCDTGSVQRQKNDEDITVQISFTLNGEPHYLCLSGVQTATLPDAERG